MRGLAVLFALLTGLIGAAGFVSSAQECTFRNPLLPVGQDPSAVYHDGHYYLTQATAGAITIAASETLTGLDGAVPTIIYTRSPGEPPLFDLWAPELVYLDGEPEGEWLLYVAATDAPGDNASHRLYGLRALTDDPQGEWSRPQRIHIPPDDAWAIDAVVFAFDDALYMVWSGWEDTAEFPQNLYITALSDPLTVAGERVRLSTPDRPWEQTVAPIQEGPQPFIHDGRLSIVYSADASWTAAYKVGILTLDGSDPLDPDDWSKHGPVFAQTEAPDDAVYGPGHTSSPLPSPDGTESWFLYHAKTFAADGWGDRSIRAQSFTWNDAALPVFPTPAPVGVALPVPDGEPCPASAAASP